MKNNFQSWVTYFQLNHRYLLSVDWEDDYQLSEEELAAIFSSLQQFQQGEYSEGKFLMKQARKFVGDQPEHSYIKALILFIKEEQRHAMTLGKFLDQQGIPKLKHHWVDEIFRKLRRFAGLELSISVLVVAEVISSIYYKALKLATRSRILQQICNQILWDEKHHLQFQASALRAIEERKHPSFRWILPVFTQFLLSGTILLVYLQHRSVFKAGGMKFRRFWKGCWREYCEMRAFQPDAVKVEEFEFVMG